MCKNQQSFLLFYLFKCLLSFFGGENVIGEGLIKETAIAVKGGQNISILRWRHFWIYWIASWNKSSMYLDQCHEDRVNAELTTNIVYYKHMILY